MSNTFKQWMIDQYDQEELYTITEHGCISGCAGGLIYYSDTLEIYDKYDDELHTAMNDYKEQTGEWPSYVVENLSSVVAFKNAVVWFVAETYAYELTQESTN